MASGNQYQCCCTKQIVAHYACGWKKNLQKELTHEARTKQRFSKFFDTGIGERGVDISDNRYLNYLALRSTINSNLCLRRLSGLHPLACSSSELTSKTINSFTHMVGMLSRDTHTHKLKHAPTEPTAPMFERSMSIHALAVSRRNY
jgi:hypothetical protein